MWLGAPHNRSGHSCAIRLRRTVPNYYSEKSSHLPKQWRIGLPIQLQHFSHQKLTLLPHALIYERPPFFLTRLCPQWQRECHAHKNAVFLDCPLPSNETFPLELMSGRDPLLTVSRSLRAVAFVFGNISFTLKIYYIYFSWYPQENFNMTRRVTYVTLASILPFRHSFKFRCIYGVAHPHFQCLLWNFICVLITKQFIHNEMKWV
jgi:hypothetical protein